MGLLGSLLLFPALQPSLRIKNLVDASGCGRGEALSPVLPLALISLHIHFHIHQLIIRQSKAARNGAGDGAGDGAGKGMPLVNKGPWVSYSPGCSWLHLHCMYLHTNAHVCVYARLFKCAIHI